MDDDIKDELQRLREYADASSQPFEHVAAETIVQYRRSLRSTRQALADIQQHNHFERFPMAPVPE